MTGSTALQNAASRRQLPALDPRGNAWVEANAGTGKTKVLTDRIVRLLLDDVRPERILCLTFTKAAAAEMQNRLSAMLGRWAFADDATLSRQLGAVLDRRPQAEETLRARRLFARVLDAPGGIAIQTIHSFCQALLRRFPLEAGVPPNAVVLDEGQAEALLRRARDEQLRELAAEDSDPALRRALSTVGSRISDSEYVRLMDGLLVERNRLQTFEGDGLTLADRDLRHLLGVPPQATAEAFLATICADDAFDRAALAAATKTLAKGSAADIERGALIGGWLHSTIEDRQASFDLYCTAYLNKDGGIRIRMATQSARRAMANIMEILQTEAERLVQCAECARGLRLVEATMSLLRLGVDILARYARLKREHAALDYDDLVLVARRLLEAPEAGAWVLYKLDGGIDHVLIDEAQDTNPDQWEVVRRVTDEFFAGAYAATRPRTVFAVGDAKQSIFGFQRADPAKLAQMREAMRQQSSEAQQAFHNVDLVHSFRSTEAVLSAVDQVFADPRASVGVVAPGAAQLKHLAIRSGEPGVVEVWPLVADDPRSADEVIAPDAPPHAGSSSEERLARLITAHIGKLVGEDVNARTGAKLTPGDVMILVRRRNALVPALVRSLKQADIAVAGVDRLVLTDELAVRDLMALGQFVLLPQDDLNLACLLKSPLVGLDEQALFDLAHGRQGRLWASLRERREDPRFAAAYARLGDWLARADFTPPFEFYARVLGPERARERLLERLGREAQDPIDEFLAMTMRYQRGEPPSLQGFLRWLEEGGSEIKRDFDQNRRPEVRILTVHASKGLQAPVVYLPDTTRVPRWNDERVLWPDDGAPPLWLARSADANRAATALRVAAIDRNRQEHNRLLYVAMTRAADRLYVCGAVSAKPPDGGCWYDLVRSALHARAVASDAPAEADQPRLFAFDSSALIGNEGWTGDILRIAIGGRPGGRSDPPLPLAGVAQLPTWATTPAPAERDPPQPLAPSRAYRVEPDPTGAPAEPLEPPPLSPLARDGLDRFKRGGLIHRLLQTLPNLPAAERGAAALRFLQQPAHGLAAAEIDAWAAETLAVIEHPDAAPLFAPGSRAEVPIAGTVQLGGRTFVVAGQADRLAVGSQEILIVDYKTNRPPPERIEDVPAVYRRQLALYRALMTDLYPDRQIRCFLLWTFGPRLMELDRHTLDGAI
jgi:ATP-dependent helicase/nuclease subunit A